MRSTVIALLLLLSACTGNVQKLKEAAPKAEDYAGALAAEYLSYGDSERELGHPYVGDYFAGKGLDALAGKTVLPDEVSKDLQPADGNMLTAARKALITLQTDEMKQVTPRKLARAQMLLDCWQRQLITHAQKEIAPCADEFSSSLIELQDQADQFITGKETTHVITFAVKSTELSKHANKTLDEIVKRASKYRNYGIQIDGHIEEYAAGSVSRTLAQERMEEVRRQLVVRNIADENILVLRDRHVSHLASVSLSSDAPRPQRRISITLRTYSASESNQ